MIAPAPVSLPVVPTAIAAADVRAPGDFFRCVPYGARFTAATCVKRQRLARMQRSQGGVGSGRITSAVANARLIGDYALCRECADGAAIAKRIGN